MNIYVTKTFDAADPQTPTNIDLWLNSFGGDIGAHRANICNALEVNGMVFITISYFKAE